ncbi:MAG: cytochrome c [Acidobacteria bacterium]|nr:cytochrome c [Acidobacteriota bacterium]
MKAPSGPGTSCRNCHGGDGEGAFGPGLAGRIDLTYERFRDYVRNPVGRMPAYVESELTDQEIADLVAYFSSLPPVVKPGAWRVELPKDAARGQQLAIAVIGCGQCHGATFETPRHGAAEVDGDFEWFKRMVYDHVAAQREQWKQLDPAITPTTPQPAGPPGRNRVRMGNYSPQRLPEPVLKEIWTWAMEDLGKLVPLTARLTAGQQGLNGATYNVQVANAGVKSKGLAAEEVTVEIELPENAKVVTATGTGYQGPHRNSEGKMVAAWRLPRLSATEQQMLTLTLAQPASALRGVVHWAKPAVKADGEVMFELVSGGRGGRGGA